MVDPASGRVFDVAWLNEQSRNILWLRRVIRRNIAGYYSMELYVEYSAGFFWAAENRPRNFLVLVLWNFSDLGRVHRGAWSRACRLRIPSPTSSLHLFPSYQQPGPVNKDIYILYIYHLLHPVCCSEARALRLGCWEHIILRITDLFEHLLEACFCAIWLNYIELRKLVNCPVC